MKHIPIIIFLSSIILIVLLGCSSPKPDITSTTTSPAEELLFSRYIAIGDNITAGYQSAALTKIHQQYSFPALIARQANTPDFVQPLIGYPGLGSESFAGYGILELIYLDNPFTPNTLNPDPLIRPVPFADYPDFQPFTNPYFSDEIRNYPLPYSNLSIPGIFVEDVLNAKIALTSKSKSPLIDIVLRNPAAGNRSAFDQAKVFIPSIITCWIGTYDVLNFALLGGDPNVPLPASRQDFSKAYSELIDSLAVIVPKLSSIQPSLIAANIPDITLAPFFNTLPPVVIDTVTNAPKLDTNNNPIPLLGVNPLTDLILTSAKQAFRQGQGIPQGVLNGTGEPLADRFFLDADEIDLIKTALEDYNEAILFACTFNNVPVVDMNGFFSQISSEGGYEIAGFTFTDKFIVGGFYSLDGIHPSDLGNALIANQWLAKINRTFNLSIPMVDIVKLINELGPLTN